jgi:hypothetical protein
MIRIGIKSLILGLMVLGLVAFAALNHYFDIRRVLSLQAEVLWLIGCMASTTSLGLSFFIRSSNESPFHLSIGLEQHRLPGSLPLLSFKHRGFWIGVKNDQVPAWELGKFGFPALAGFGLLVFGLIILENRSLVLIKHFYNNLTKDYGHICPKEGEEPVTSKPPKMGCELVKKAFALGYAKDLGDCAVEVEEKVKEICTHRQWDEPGAHYSYRLIERFMLGFLGNISGLEVNKEILEKEAAAVPGLVKNHAQGFLGVLRSANHIFTDLPEPGEWLAKTRRRLHPNHCQDELRELRFRMANKGEDPGAQLEDTLGHLLFSPAVGNYSYYCRPFIVHWNADPQTCLRLLSKGEATLNELDIHQSVAGVVERQRLADLHPPPARKGQSEKPPASLEVIKQEHPLVSFHCLMSGGDPSIAQAQGTLEFANHKFPITSVILPARNENGLYPTHELFTAVARAFVPDYNYTSLDRKPVLSLSEDRFRSEIARGGDKLMLAKFELLRSSDVLAGDQWVYNYPDFLAVYPWQPHMSNFVNRFRRTYQLREVKP